MAGRNFGLYSRSFAFSSTRATKIPSHWLVCLSWATILPPLLQRTTFARNSFSSFNSKTTSTSSAMTVKPRSNGNNYAYLNDFSNFYILISFCFRWFDCLTSAAGTSSRQRLISSRHNITSTTTSATSAAATASNSMNSGDKKEK